MRKALKSLARECVKMLPQNFLLRLTSLIADARPQTIIAAVGPKLNRAPTLDTMPFDLPLGDKLEFEDLTGLFASTPFDHGVATMSVRQIGYLYGLIKRMPARKVIEIGRYKGGSTLAIAAAMPKGGQFWSIDIGEKEKRLYAENMRSFDDQLRDMCKRFGLEINIIIGDSKTLQIDTGEVDLVFIDGDHSYEGAKNDFDRFGKRIRVGGSILFDDAFSDRMFESHAAEVGRLIKEIIAEGKFKLVKAVNHLAHLERVKAD